MLELRGSRAEPGLLSDARGGIDLHSGQVSQIDDFHSALTAAGGSGGNKVERRKQSIERQQRY